MSLTTARLLLRVAEPRDAEGLHAIYSDPECMKYWSTGPDKSLEDTAARIPRKAGHGATGYFVFEKDGEVVGNGGHVAGGEIGYILRRDHWGQGLAYEAMAAIIPHLWDILDVPLLRAEADPRNTRSVTLLSRLGFEVAGFATENFMVEGQLHDTVYMRLKRPL